MAQPYKKFNLICAILSAFFLLGTVWIYVRTTPPKADAPWAQKITNYEIKIEQNKNIEIVKILPARINLDVPFTSQAPEKDWGQPWQDACEEAALLMLDGYYKKYNLSPLFAKDEIIKMVEWEEKQGWGRSIEMEKVRLTLEHFST